MANKAKFDVEGLGRVGHALGAVNGVAVEAQTNAFVTDIVRAASDYAADVMGQEIDKIASADGRKLNHVYEWGQAGSPTGRLFTIFAKGNGRTRAVSFAFTASKVAVPTLRERIASGEVLPIPDRILNRMAEGGNKKYYFRQKAQYMEYGGNVTIRPRSGQKILVPFSRPINGRTFAFVDSTRVSFAGKKHRGMFHAAWKLAQVTAGQQAEAMINREMNAATRTIEARMGKTGTKGLKIGFTQGQDYARNRMKLAGKMANAQVRRAGKIQ